MLQVKKKSVIKSQAQSAMKYNYKKTNMASVLSKVVFSFIIIDKVRYHKNLDFSPSSLSTSMIDIAYKLNEIGLGLKVKIAKLYIFLLRDNENDMS